MLTKLQNFFNQHLRETEKNTASLEHRLQLASAALMTEMIHVDDRIAEQEETKIRHLLKEKFNLSETELEELIILAQNEKHEAVDYHAFTSLLNTHYSQQQKIKLVEDLWLLAYTDNELNKYEEHLVRRLSDLLHVSHQDFMQTKHKALKTVSLKTD